MATREEAQRKRYLKRREAAKKVSLNKGDIWEFTQTIFDTFSCTFIKEVAIVEIISDCYQGMFTVLKNGEEKNMTTTEIGGNIIRFKAKKINTAKA